MQGLFSAGAIPAALGILGSAYPPGQRKNKVFATFSAGNPSGWVIGLIIGGLLTSYSSWRWGFRVIAILSGLVTVIAFVYIPQDPPRDAARRGEKVDWLGALFVICGMGGICYALRYTALKLSNGSDAGNAANGWKTWYIIFSLLIGFVFIGAFLFLESKVQHPLMPLAIWKVPQFGRVMFIIALGFGCFTGFLGFTWSLWFQQIDRASPITVYPILPSLM
jgi:MFS family permease